MISSTGSMAKPTAPTACAYVLGSDGVFGLRAPFPTTAFVEVLRFELMVERGLFEAATSIREEAQHEALCRIGCFGERDRHLHRR